MDGHRGNGCRASDVDHGYRAAGLTIGDLVVGCVEVASVRTDHDARTASIPQRLRNVLAGIDDQHRPVIADNKQLLAVGIHHQTFHRPGDGNPRHDVLPAIDDHDRIAPGDIDVLAVRAYGDVVHAAADRDRRDGGFCRHPDRAYVSRHACVTSNLRPGNTIAETVEPVDVQATTVSPVVGARSQRPPPPGPDRVPRHRRGRDVVIAHIAIGADRDDTRGCRPAAA